MKRKHLTLFLALALSSSFALLAQTPDQSAAPQAQPQQQTERRLPDPAHQAKMLARKLNLTDDQVKQIEPILANRIQQIQAIRADSSLAPKDRAAKMRDLRQQTQASIKAVLNDDQKQKYDQLQQEMRQHRQEHKERQEQPQSSAS